MSAKDPSGNSTNGPSDDSGKGTAEEGESRRQAVRLTTVYGGRVCQYGRAYACIISDVSEGGAKVRLKDPHDFDKIKKTGEIQLIFERLSDYKALNTEVAWLKPDEFTVGLRFIDPQLRRRVVMKRLMPNRWRIANESGDEEEQGGGADTSPGSA